MPTGANICRNTEGGPPPSLRSSCFVARLKADWTIIDEGVCSIDLKLVDGEDMYYSPTSGELIAAQL